MNNLASARRCQLSYVSAHSSMPVAWQAAAANALAAAMMAVLPGIDANDEQKTLAAFRFFCIVLSSVGELSVLFLGF